MDTRIQATRRRLQRALAGPVAAFALLLATSLTASANDTASEPSTYLDCWLGNWERYEACVEANNWGATFVDARQTTRFVFPDRDDVALMIGRLPSY